MGIIPSLAKESMDKKQTGMIGKKGERLAEAFYIANGFKLLGRNYRTRYGEIDLIFSGNNSVVFVEVKGRRSLECGLPEEHVTRTKQKKIITTAAYFLQQNNMSDSNIRFDIYSIIWDKKYGVSKAYQIENAFALD